VPVESTTPTVPLTLQSFSPALVPGGGPAPRLRQTRKRDQLLGGSSQAGRLKLDATTSSFLPQGSSATVIYYVTILSGGGDR